MEQRKSDTSLKLLKAPLKTSKAAVPLRRLGRGHGHFGLKRTASSSRVAPNIKLQTRKVRKKVLNGIKGTISFPINSNISLHGIFFLEIPIFQQLHYCSVYHRSCSVGVQLLSYFCTTIFLLLVGQKIIHVLTVHV